ncbi:hypothetical protein K0M31_013757 [Melipona bicolor]|uniref:Uncharacterized protein n=1 Tax=Melipona bicolor TaxID=60889 RepID=A0AA40FH67_9HYME|nr:hypothetical protein K0M31_013757 [Melipona bicolor]
MDIDTTKTKHEFKREKQKETAKDAEFDQICFIHVIKRSDKRKTGILASRPRNWLKPVETFSEAAATFFLSELGLQFRAPATFTAISVASCVDGDGSSKADSVEVYRGSVEADLRVNLFLAP